MKVLVVRFSAIGDCVMTAWATTALRNAMPDAWIAWAVQERCAPVVDTASLVNRVHVFPRERWKKHRWSPTTWREQIVRYTSLRKERIDVGFDFQGHSKTAICLRLAGCKERYSSRATDALSARINPPVKLTPEGPHEVQIAMALIGNRFEVTMPDKPVVPAFQAERSLWQQTFTDDRPLVTIQTGAGEPDKLYTATNWSKIAQDLDSAGFNVVAIGGPNDPHVPGASSRDEVGKHSLQSSLAVVSMSRLHLSADTGTGHAAAAYGVPVVSVFGRTDPDRFRPWTQHGKVLRHGTATDNVTPDEVTEAALALMEEGHLAHSH